MEFLRKIGQVLGEHYEKIILTLVLLGLAVAVAYVYQASQSEEQKLRAFTKKIEKAKVNPVKAVDLSEYEAVMQVAQKPPALNYSQPHNLFNPVKWKRAADGRLIKEVTGEEVIRQLVVTKITPLNFVITVSRPAGPGWWINITNELAVGGKRFIAQYTLLNETNKQVFILRDARGTNEDATLVLELKDTGERISISKEKPFVRPDAYEADLSFPPEKKTFLKQRAGAFIRFGGEDYNIIAINPEGVVLSAPNGRKYTIPAKRTSSEQTSSSVLKP